MKRMDVSEFNAFEIRVRGDGRKFFANIQSPGLASRKENVWQYFIFTRGGPEWENIIVSGNCDCAMHLNFSDAYTCSYVV